MSIRKLFAAAACCAFFTNPFIAGRSIAATVFETTEVVASPLSLEAQLPPAMAFSLPAGVTGSYVVTLEDLGAPAALESLQAVVVRGLEVVAQVAIDPQARVPVSDSFVASAGEYRVHVLGTVKNGQGGGSFRISVTPAAGGAAVLEELGAITDNGGPGIATSVLQTTFNLAQGGTYQLAVTDHAFPVALAKQPDVLLLRQTPAGPEVITRNTGAFTTLAGTHELVVIAEGASPNYAGLYGITISGGPSAGIAYRSTNPVGRMPSPVQVELTGGAHSLSLADAKFPVPLSGFRAALVQSGAVLGVREGEGSTAITAASGPAQLYMHGGETNVGAFTVRLAKDSQVVYADVRTVDAPFKVVSNKPLQIGERIIYSFASPEPVAAGAYRLAVNDLRFPGVFSSLDAAIVQGDVIVDRIDRAAPLSATLASGPVRVLVAARLPQAAQDSALGSGLFGVALTAQPAGTLILESTQGVGGLFRSRAVTVAQAGRYDLTLTDLRFPEPLKTGALAITRGTELIGQIFGSGTFSQQLEAGTYALSFLGQPAAGKSHGAYGLKVASSPPAPAITFSANPTTVTTGERTTLTWSATNANACTASGAWSGNKSVSGTEQSGVLNTSATFDLTCTGPGGSANASVSIGVAAPAARRGGGGGGQIGPELYIYMVLLALLRRSVAPRSANLRR